MLVERFVDQIRESTIGIAAALILVTLLLLLLPRSQRHYIRAPVLLLLAHIVAMLVRSFIPETWSLHAGLQLAALFFILLSVGRGLLILVLHVLAFGRSSRPLPRIFSDLLMTLVYLASLLVTLRAAGVEPGSLLTTSALLTAVIGLSLQDTLGNLFAGLAIHAQRPFELGHWIELETDRGMAGQVIEMNWRAVKILTTDNYEVAIPNAMLAKTPIRNYSVPDADVQRRVALVASSETSPRRLHSIILSAVSELKGIARPSVVTKAFVAGGVEYDLRYFISRFEDREVLESLVRERLWYAMRREDVPVSFISLPGRDTQTSKEQWQERLLERRVKVLRGVDFLQALPAEDLRSLAKDTTERIYAPGETILRRGDVGHELFVVKSGDVQVSTKPDTGKTLEVVRLGPGSFFGEMSLMTGEPRRANVKAITEVEVVVVGKHALQPLLDGSPELMSAISQALAQRVEQLDETLLAATVTRDSIQETHKDALLARIKHFFSR